MTRYNSAPPANPVCTGEQIKQLGAYLLDALPKLGGATNNVGQPSINHATYGELELVHAMVTLCDWMVDFGFFVENRNDVVADFSSIKTMIHGIFRILDTSDTDPRTDSREARGREDSMRIDVRLQALKLLLRLFNMRANYRISVALGSWSALFEMKGVSQQLASLTARHALEREEAEAEAFRKKLFGSHGKVFTELEKKMFATNCVSPEEVSCDIYKAGKYDKDHCCRVLLNLCQFNSAEMNNLATQVLVRHMSQRTRVMKDLWQTQVLVFPAAVKVYEETTFAIERLTSLKKQLDADEEDAYSEAMWLLGELRSIAHLMLVLSRSPSKPPDHS
jgi:hypothetical protein